jgi:hypothetical protein
MNGRATTIADRQQDDAHQQPEAGTGVDHLAQLDTRQAEEARAATGITAGDR